MRSCTCYRLKHSKPPKHPRTETPDAIGSQSKHTYSVYIQPPVKYHTSEINLKTTCSLCATHCAKKPLPLVGVGTPKQSLQLVALPP